MSSWYGDAGGSKYIMMRALGMITLAALSGPSRGPHLGPSWSPFGALRGALKQQKKTLEGPKEAPKGPQELTTAGGSVGT